MPGAGGACLTELSVGACAPLSGLAAGELFRDAPAPARSSSATGLRAGGTSDSEDHTSLGAAGWSESHDPVDHVWRETAAGGAESGTCTGTGAGPGAELLPGTSGGPVTRTAGGGSGSGTSIAWFARIPVCLHRVCLPAGVVADTLCFCVGARAPFLGISPRWT